MGDREEIGSFSCQLMSSLCMIEAGADSEARLENIVAHSVQLVCVMFPVLFVYPNSPKPILASAWHPHRTAKLPIARIKISPSLNRWEPPVPRWGGGGGGGAAAQKAFQGSLFLVLNAAVELTEKKRWGVGRMSTIAGNDVLFILIISTLPFWLIFYYFYLF